MVAVCSYQTLVPEDQVGDKWQPFRLQGLSKTSVQMVGLLATGCDVHWKQFEVLVGTRDKRY
jgi:hypothetical protein